jgi:hypothetical protein
MIRSALLLCAGVIAAACFGCAPPPKPTPVGTATGACPDGTPFLDHVRFVVSGYQPYPGFMDPPVDSNIKLTSQEASDLQAAFDLAPVAFQARLCGLDGIYLDPTACNAPTACIEASWGFRQPWAKGKRYIAVSTGLWSLMNRPRYDQFETDLLQILADSNAFSFKMASFGFDMTLLAALAHEVGHVRWYDILDPDHKEAAPDFSRLCDGGFFLSWGNPLTPPPQWRQLQTPEVQRQQKFIYRHQSGPQTYEFDQAISSRQIEVAGDILQMFFGGTASWASYFASLSADEDFVETYKFAVLTHATTRLDHLPIIIQGTSRNYPEDIPAAYWAAVNGSDTSKAALALKTHCVAGLI